MSVVVSQVPIVVVEVPVVEVKKVAGWITNPELWVKNETTKRMMKINGATHKKMMGEDNSKNIPAWKANPEQWVKNETTKRMVKIGSDTHKKMLGETVEKKIIDKSKMILNPTGTGRWIKIDGKIYKKLKEEGKIPILSEAE